MDTDGEMSTCEGMLWSFRLGRLPTACRNGTLLDKKHKVRGCPAWAKRVKCMGIEISDLGF